MTATFVAGPCFLLPKTKGVNEVRIVWMLKFRRKLANNFQIFEVFSPRFDKDCGSELILLLLTFMVDTNSAIWEWAATGCPTKHKGQPLKY